MDLTEIGYFSKTHGTKGHLILKSEREFHFEEMKALFVERSGSKAPYFVMEARETNNDLIILLEEILSIEKAKLLIGKKVFIDSSLIDEDEEQTDWIGYELVDDMHGSLGKIIEVSDNGAQLLVSVLYKEKEVILPLTDNFIESVDDSARVIKFKAPEGLIDIYLNEK